MVKPLKHVFHRKYDTMKNLYKSLFYIKENILIKNFKQILGEAF